MATIKENALSKHASEAAALLAEKFIRIVTAQNSGDSKLMQIKDMLFQISNINGLQTAIDGLISKVTGVTGDIPSFLASGQLESSGFSIGTFGQGGHASTELDALTGDGFYYEDLLDPDDPAEIIVCGRVYAAYIIKNREILFTENGLWYREYSTTWSSFPSYVGGAKDSITRTYLQALTLISASALSPGAKYKITADGGSLYQDLGIVLTAATPSTFESDGLRFAVIPKVSYSGTVDGIEWGGMWNPFLSSVTQDHYYVAFGKVYKSLTGATGTATTFTLDATNWLLIDPITNIGDYYVVKEMGITYRIGELNSYAYPYGYIVKQWNDAGVCLGEDNEPIDYFHIDFNDWSHALSMNASNITLARFYLNSIGIGDYYYRGIIGIGQVHSNYNCTVANVTMSGENCIISGNHNGYIGNCILNYEAKIIDNVATLDSGSGNGAFAITGSEIGGEIEANAYNPSAGYDYFAITDSRIGKSGDIKRCHGTVTECVVDGDLKDLGNTSGGRMNISYSTIESGSDIHDIASVLIRDTLIRAERDIVCASLTLTDCIVDTSISAVGSTITRTNSDVKIYASTDENRTTYLVKSGTRPKIGTDIYGDIFVPIASGPQPSSNAPTWTAFTANTNAYTFAIEDYKDMGTIEIPHDYKEGTNLEVHLHIANNGQDTTERKCLYQIYYTYGVPDNGTHQFTAEALLSGTLTIPANTPTRSAFYLTLGTIAGTNIKIGTQLKMRVIRGATPVGGTAPTANPFLGQVGVHYIKDGFGSMTMSAK